MAKSWPVREQALRKLAVRGGDHILNHLQSQRCKWPHSYFHGTQLPEDGYAPCWRMLPEPVMVKLSEKKSALPMEGTEPWGKR